MYFTYGSQISIPEKETMKDAKYTNKMSEITADSVRAVAQNVLTGRGGFLSGEGGGGGLDLSWSPGCVMILPTVLYEPLGPSLKDWVVRRF